MNRKIASLVAAAALSFTMSTNVVSAAEYASIPPNMIGVVLAPSGYEGKIYSPGQVDIGGSWASGYGSKLVLIQRSGFFVKERFGRNDPDNLNDKEDHRCIVGPDREPMTLDVRLILAIPDYEKPDGKDALMRLMALGNVVLADKMGTSTGNTGRIWIFSSESVYHEQVQQQVRGAIRQVCIGYPNVEAVYKAVEDGSFNEKLKSVVARALFAHGVPLRLIEATISNVKSDQTVVDATAANMAAKRRIETIKTVESFLNEDKTGVRAQLFKQLLAQEMAARGNMIMTDVVNGAAPAVVPKTQ